MEDPTFTEFVSTVAPTLVRISRSISAPRQDYEALAQEALIRVYTHWRQLDPAKAAGYAYRTLVRLIRRDAARTMFRREIPTDVDLEQVDEGVMDNGRLSNDLSVYLRGLPLRQREVLVLRFYVDLDVETTAKVMHCSSGTVKSQTSKAIATLKTRLNQRQSERSENERASYG